MNDETIRRAVAESKRFLEAVDALSARRTKEAKKDKTTMLYVWQGCRESGAVRRASMDLSRALADLRRP